MSSFVVASGVYSARASRLATPTHRCNTFSVADAEVSAITADCAEREQPFVRQHSHHRKNASTCTPVRVADAPSCGRRQCDTTSPTKVPCEATDLFCLVSPRRRRCAGHSFTDMDALYGSPRVHLAVPPTPRRPHGCDVSQLGVRAGALISQDNVFNVINTKPILCPASGSRSASEPKTTTPSLSNTPIEHNEHSTSSKHPFLRSATEWVTADEATSAHKCSRPPSSPSFSFFSNVGERRHSRAQTAVDSARNGEGKPFVSPRSFALHVQQSPCKNTSAASLSSSALPVEVKVFSPLRFDARAVPSIHSQGLSSVSPSHYSSVPLSLPHLDDAHWGSGDEREEATPRLDSGSQGESDEERGTLAVVQDRAKQQRLLHACLLSMAREKRELEREVQHLRRRCTTELLALLFRVLLRLPFRVLKQLFIVCASKLGIYCGPAGTSAPLVH